MRQPEVRLPEDGLEGVGGVRDDHFVGGFVVGKEFEAVADPDGYFWEVGFGDADDSLGCGVS